MPPLPKAKPSPNQVTVLGTVSVLEFPGGDGSARVNVFAENPTVPNMSETAVLTFTVPALKTLRLTSFGAWADVDAEYKVKVDGTQIDGGRTSIAIPTLEKGFYADSPLISAGSIVSITVYRQSASPNLPFKAVLRGVYTNA